MGMHTEHQMQLTSLLCKWGNYTEEQYNSKFRQQTEIRILQFHQQYPDGLTDSELLQLFGNPDTDLIRPRRSDLSKEKKKRNEIRPAFLIDSGETRKNRLGINCIVWKLNPENLYNYLIKE
jgi:hypothetical protein